MLLNFLGPEVTKFHNKHECLLRQAFPAFSDVCGLGQEPTLKWSTLKGVSLGQVPALPANTILSWKNLQGTNTLAYYEKS